jgi:hypothetical protein
MSHMFPDKRFPFFKFLSDVPAFDSKQRTTRDGWGRLAAGLPMASTSGGVVLGHGTSVNVVNMTRGSLEQPSRVRAQVVRSSRVGDGAPAGGAAGEGCRKGRCVAVEAWRGVESWEVQLVLVEEDE